MIQERNTEKVDVIGYTVAVETRGLCVTLKADEGCEPFELSMYPEESKALRKALKRAEKIHAAAAR